MPNMFTDEGKNSKHTDTLTQTYVYIYKKGERTTSKFKNYKTPHDAHLQTQKKPLVKPQTTPTPTHTHNYKHIKYQRRVKQTKVNTLQERGKRTPI